MKQIWSVFVTLIELKVRPDKVCPALRDQRQIGWKYGCRGCRIARCRQVRYTKIGRGRRAYVVHSSRARGMESKGDILTGCKDPALSRL